MQDIKGRDQLSLVVFTCRQGFGIVGIQVAGTAMYLNVLVKDLAGIPRYFNLDHVGIPLSPHQSRLKFLICLLLTLRNIVWNVFSCVVVICTLKSLNMHVLHVCCEASPYQIILKDLLAIQPSFALLEWFLFKRKNKFILF